LFPNTIDITVTADADELVESLERATIISSGMNDNPTIFDITDNNINIRKVSTKSKFNEDIDVVKEGNDIKIGLNPIFLLDAIKATGQSEVKIQMVNNNTPIFIMDDNGEYIYVVLPIHV
jgi:DNA polymerase-3 subunit beta